MKEDLRLAVVGVGGVGGLLAGALIRRYGDRVSLAARGARGAALRERGLTLHSDLFGEFTVRPGTVAESAGELPVQDVILVCVKNGDLPKAAEQMAPAVGPDTIVLTVMNGVTAGSVLRAALGRGQVLESVIYTVAGAGKDYSVTQQGKYTQVFTGGEDAAGRAAAEEIAALFNGAGIDCRVSGDIQAAIWKKYVLNCAYNVATARWGCPIGGIKADPARLADCRAMMEEARAVGLARGVDLPEDILEKNMARIVKNTDDSESSLSRDFAARRTGELEVFSGEVVRMAAEAGIPVPVTAAYDQALREIAAAF